MNININMMKKRLFTTLKTSAIDLVCEVTDTTNGTISYLPARQIS